MIRGTILKGIESSFRWKISIEKNNGFDIYKKDYSQTVSFHRSYSMVSSSIAVR